MAELLDLQKDSISTQLYNDLLTGIEVGDYPALGPLPTEARLANDYGVSRAVVRSALSILKEEGIIASRQGSGTIVVSNDVSNLSAPISTVDSEDVKKCYQCREAMEPEIAALAAANRTRKHVRYLEGQLGLIEDYLRSDTIHTSNDADFHVQLAIMSDNKYFESIMTSLRPHMLIGMNITKTLSEEDRKAHESAALCEHRNIARAIINEDCAAARQAMQNHLVFGKKRVFAAF